MENNIIISFAVILSLESVLYFPTHTQMNIVCISYCIVHSAIGLYAVADPECARGGGVSHNLAEKRGVSFALLKKMHENSKLSPITGGGGGTPGTPYAGSATDMIIYLIYLFIFIQYIYEYIYSVHLR